MDNTCLFCKIINKEIPARIIFEDEEIIAFNDIDPQSRIHILVVPKKHIETLNDITEADVPLLGKIFSAIKELACKNSVSEEGYRVVANCNKMAGQEVFHIHFHLLAGRKFTWPPG